MALAWARRSRPAIWHLVALLVGLVTVPLLLEVTLGGPSILGSAAVGGATAGLVWWTWARLHAGRILRVSQHTALPQPERPAL